MTTTQHRTHQPHGATIARRPTTSTHALLTELRDAAADLATLSEVEAWARAETLIAAVAPITGTPEGDVVPSDPAVVSLRTLAAVIRRLQARSYGPQHAVERARATIAAALAIH